MFNRQLYWNFTVRIVLISTFITLLVIAIYRKVDFLTIGNLLFFTLLQIFLLIRKFNRVNKELINFFDTILNDDSNITYATKQKDYLIQQLHKRFAEVNQMIRNIKIEHVSQYHFLQIIVQHVNVGLLLLDEKGNVELINKAAKNLLGVSDISNINQLEKENQKLSSLLIKIKPGKSKTIQIHGVQSNIKLNIRATYIKIKDELKRLISLQNIKSELEQHELETWQKLIRILTHEIMNSTAPISSSIKVIMNLLTDIKSGHSKSINSLDQETIDHVVNGLRIIEDRSEGLNEFVTSYRSLTQKVKPYFSLFSVSDLLSNVGFLVQDELQQLGIEFEVVKPDSDFSFYADKKLIEQVLLNLIKNAKEALIGCDKMKISIISREQDERKTLHVIDSGPGINKDVQDQIFIPFYSTKEKGTGIGLSLSREIMKQNRGTLTFATEPGRTEFILEF